MLYIDNSVRYIPAIGKIFPESFLSIGLCVGNPDPNSEFKKEIFPENFLVYPTTCFFGLIVHK